MAVIITSVGLTQVNMWSLSSIKRATDALLDQCKALSLMHITCNTCVLKRGHGGAHENALGSTFTRAVKTACDLPPRYGDQCQDHPRYRFKRKPSGNCEMCWRIWVKKNQ